MTKLLFVTFVFAVLQLLASAYELPPFASKFRNGQEIQAGIDAAIAAGASTYALPSGNFAFFDRSGGSRIKGKSFSIAGGSNMRITGAGVAKTQLWFVPGFGVDIDGCTNVTLESFSADTLTPAFSQGTLVSLDLPGGTATLQIEHGFPRPSDPELFNQTCPGGGSGCGEVKVVFWDPSTRRMLQGQQMNNPMKNATCWSDHYGNGPKYINDNAITCSISIPALDVNWAVPPAKGTLVTISPRLWATNRPIPTFYRGTFGVYNCSDMLFQEIDTYGSGCMVWVENLGAGRNTYRRVRVIRRPEAMWPAGEGYCPTRLLAANLDTFHSMSCGVGPTVEDCEFSFVGDDYINIHNRLLPLGRLDMPASTNSAATSSFATAWVLDVGNVPGHGYTGPTDDGSRNPHISHTMDFVKAGDELKLFQGEPPYAFISTLTVTTTPEAVGNDTAKLPTLPQALANRVEPDSLVIYRVSLEVNGNKLPPIDAFSVLVQVDRFTSRGAVVQRTKFHDSYNNVARLAASDILYRDNTVDRNGDGIHISDDIAGYNFLEGSLGRSNITIASNNFTQVRGCGSQRKGTEGCAHICTNTSCVLSHVDPELTHVVNATGNWAGTGAM